MTYLATNLVNAVKRGFATFNKGPHLLVDVPDGNFTISAKTSSGKRVTFAFAPYKKDGEAGCVDVSYHDSGKTLSNNEEDLPAFNTIGFTPGGGKETESTIVAVLLDDSHYEKA
jgi:hypothetical protein